MTLSYPPPNKPISAVSHNLYLPSSDILSWWIVGKTYWQRQAELCTSTYCLKILTHHASVQLLSL